MDRLPILVTGENISKILAVPALPKGTASIEANSIKETLEDWGITDRISAMCFDTTAVNSGQRMGVINQLPRMIGKKMLPLACRHHVAEVVLKHVFEVVGDESRSGTFDEFRSFQLKLNDGIIDVKKYRTAMTYSALRRQVMPWKDSVIAFCLEQLQIRQPRGDYKELLELVVMFLGANPPQGPRFRKAGAISRARWMARAIYTLKIWMLGGQLKEIGTTLMNHYKTICVFIAQCYVKFWFRLTLAAAAPRVDLEFDKAAFDFQEKKYSQIAIRAFSNHLWYFSGSTIALSFFDNEVETEEKREMVKALTKSKIQTVDEQNQYKPPCKPTEIHKNSCLSDFITAQSYDFFEILNIDKDFLTKDPEEWPQMKEYIVAQKRVQALQVVNDIAERAVKLASDFNGKLTKDPDQEQFLLQVVEYHRSLNK